jgi:hypothetical protein
MFFEKSSIELKDWVSIVHAKNCFIHSLSNYFVVAKLGAVVVFCRLTCSFSESTLSDFCPPQSRTHDLCLSTHPVFLSMAVLASSLFVQLVGTPTNDLLYVQG